MKSQALIRPAWTPATIALMVLGFIAYWPLGLAVLAYILWGDRLDTFRNDVNRTTDRVFGGLKRSGANLPFGEGRTGNLAFDEWREGELKRLDAERRRLDEDRAEFESYVRELRRAKDREEFDRFRASRRGAEGPIVDAN